MKKIILMLAMGMAALLSYGQTNTFPSSGNVGIGTTSPGAKLEVEDGILRIGDGAGSYSGFYFNTSTGLTQENNNRVTLNGALNVNCTTGSVNYITGGNVGIGTTTPAANLDVSGVNSGIQITGTNISSLNFSSPSSFANINTYNDGTLRFHSSSTGFNSADNQLVLVSGGNVAIGTTDPQGYKLAVNGSAIATSMTVKLNSAWPDYVFKPTYKLPALADLKTYIGLNHHLPDMPSERQVAKEGLNLGEMNKLLTKKVEELTLYMIEKDKADKVKQSEITQLKKQLIALTKSLTKK